MKKIVLSIICMSLLGVHSKAQDSGNNFDKKFRFGLRITPQPTWFTTGDKNIEPNGAKFGFGFGLNMEYKLSDVASILTGIGGDFEGGKYKYRNDPGTYSVYYELNEKGEFVAPVNGLNIPKRSVVKTTNTGYKVKQRTMSTTYITIPAILKLSTNEYSGVKYFGMFGVEVAFRARAEATDTYFESYSYGKDTILPEVTSGGSQSKLNIGGFKGDAAGGIARLGLNVGLGAEYRLGGTTSFFGSINFFRSFFNVVSKNSDYMTYKTDYATGSKNANEFIEQNLIFNAVRINLGFMF
jgi:hypothetical protein